MGRFAPPGPPYVGHRGPNGLFNPFGSKRASSGGGGAITYATWNPADKGTDITLSGGNLVATNTTDNAATVRATVGKSSGKWYWEITTTGHANQGWLFGIADATTSISGGITLGGFAKSASIQSGTSLIRATGGPTADTLTVVDSANGMIWGLALDMDNGRVYIRRNGVWQNSGGPAAGTGFFAHDLSGTFYPAQGLFWNNMVATANFGATTFAHSVPTGFTSGVTA